MDKNIIVGYDPGTTVGIAILDTDGKLIEVFSQKNLSKDEVIKFISSFGRPIIVATDKKPPPKSVLYVASKFGSKIFYPKKEMKVKEKDKIVEKYGVYINNDHERDALSAAVKSFKFYRKNLEDLKKILEKNGVKKDLNKRLYELFIFGKLSKPKKTFNTTNKKKTIVKEKIITNIDEFKREIERLQKIVQNQRREIETYKKILVNLQKMSVNNIEMERKKRYFELMKQIEKVWRNGQIPVIKIDKINHSILEEMDEEIGMDDRIVYTNDIDNLSSLKHYNILFVITDLDVDEKDVFVVKKSDIGLKKYDGVFYITKKEYENIMKVIEKWRIEKLVKEYQEKRKRRKI